MHVRAARDSARLFSSERRGRSVTERSSKTFGKHDFVASYERWYETTGHRADELEKQLLEELLEGVPTVETVLEVGCGTGHFSRWFETRGLRVVGLDLSLEMLAESRRLGSPPCIRGRAERLPFGPRSFDLVTFITTLEFIGDAQSALVEACRVARTGLLLGALNRHSLLGQRLTRKTSPPWTSARLYTVGELKTLVMRAAGDLRPRVHSRTTLWPAWGSSLPLPWGGFIGVRVTWSGG
jgi:ubiquinone/menaquinone biosynthesis C-methylase UbiE